MAAAALVDELAAVEAAAEAALSGTAASPCGRWADGLGDDTLAVDELLTDDEYSEDCLRAVFPAIDVPVFPFAASTCAPEAAAQGGPAAGILVSLPVPFFDTSTVPAVPIARPGQDTQEAKIRSRRAALWDCSASLVAARWPRRRQSCTAAVADEPPDAPPLREPGSAQCEVSAGASGGFSWQRLIADLSGSAGSDDARFICHHMQELLDDGSADAVRRLRVLVDLYQRDFASTRQ